jgi:hypothetical protein
MAVCCREPDFEHLPKRGSTDLGGSKRRSCLSGTPRGTRPQKKQSAAIRGALSCFTETSNLRQAAFKPCSNGTSQKRQASIRSGE